MSRTAVRTILIIVAASAVVCSLPYAIRYWIRLSIPRPLVAVLDLRTGKVKAQWEPKTSVYILALSPKGDYLATSDYVGDVDIVRLSDCSRVSLLKDSGVSDLAFDPTGRMLALVSNHGVQLWDVVHRRLVWSDKSKPGRVAICFSPDGKVLAGVDGNSLSTWDVRTGHKQPAVALSITDDDIQWKFGICLSPDSRLLACASDQMVSIHRVSDGALVRRLEAGYPARFSGNSVLVAFAPEDCRLAKWSASTRWKAKEFLSEFSLVKELSGNCSMAIADSPGGVRVFGLSDGKSLASFARPSGGFLCADFSADGTTAAVSFRVGAEPRL